MTSDDPRDPRPRTVLPIPDRPYGGPLVYDVRDPAARFPPIGPVRPPPGAPHVLLVLLDDVGFGAASAFGGPCRTPTAERLAADGLKYTRFHTTALCSPTRAALLTGRNHHMVGMGGIHAEVLKDVAVQAAPVTEEEAAEMISSLRMFPILDGARGQARADVAAAARAVARLSEFASRHRDDVAEIDMNPILVRPQGQGVVVLDALMIPRAAPAH